MTTIAYRAGTLAADSMISYGSYKNGDIPKIHIVQKPSSKGGTESVMVGMSGVCWAIQPLREWIEAGCGQDAIPHLLIQHAAEFACLMIDAEGRVFELNSGYFIECGVEYHAIGSGAQFALGAMAAGATAPEAVSAAMKHDKATGGQIMVSSTAVLTSKEAA